MTRNLEILPASYHRPVELQLRKYRQQLNLILNGLETRPQKQVEIAAPNIKNEKHFEIHIPFQFLTQGSNRFLPELELPAHL